MNLTSSDLKLTFLVGVSYLLIATGSIIPIVTDGTIFPFHTALIVLAIVVYCSLEGATVSIVRSLYIFTPLLILMLFQSLRSTDFLYAFSKIEGGIFCTIVTAFFVSRVVSKRSELYFVKKFIFISFVVLILTILYRETLGLTGRHGRFFINGPIVFGWIMGFNTVAVLYLALSNRNSNLFLLTFVFMAAMLWTGSKGPIVAVSVTTAFLLLRRIKSYRAWFGLFAFLGVTWFSYKYIVPDHITARFQVFSRMFEGSLSSSDYGSIGSRTDAWLESIMMFKSQPIFGVGLGNWREHSVSELNYPHNFIFETISELGLVGLASILLTGIYLFQKASEFGRISMIYFMISLSFSGDLSYMRFALLLPLVGAIQKQRNSEKPCSENIR